MFARDSGEKSLSGSLSPSAAAPDIVASFPPSSLTKKYIEDVARRAGMTRGAIYGNFKNRDDLFLALAAIRGAPIISRFEPGMSFAEAMRAYAEAVIAAVPQRRAAVIGALSFHAYTLTHPEIRAQVLASTGDIYRIAATMLVANYSADELPMPAETLVRVIHGLADGLLQQRFLTPELHDDEVIYAAFAALAGERLVRKPGQPKQAR
ncbi:MAG TPA: TetR family transcriptional regulator [Caulobacteraceae bacterium]